MAPPQGCERREEEGRREGLVSKGCVKEEGILLD